MITNHARTVSDLAAAGVTVPENVAAALELLKIARETVLTDPTADLRTEYEAGTLTPENIRARMIEAATVAAAAERIRLAAQTIEQGVIGTVNAWIRADAANIIKAMRPTFDKAAATVQTAGKHFAPNATAAQVLDGGAAAAAAHEKLADALATLDRLRTLRVAVAYVAREGEQTATWWIAQARDLAALEQAQRAYSGTGNAFHALAHEGFTLRMSTEAEAARVAAGARVTTETEEAAQREAELIAHRESWAPTLEALAANSPTANG
jgi:hypothetical protein